MLFTVKLLLNRKYCCQAMKYVSVFRELTEKPK